MDKSTVPIVLVSEKTQNTDIFLSVVLKTMQNTVIYISIVYQGERECRGVQRENSNKGKNVLTTTLDYDIKIVE